MQHNQDDDMRDDHLEDSTPKSGAARVVTAGKYRDGVLMGRISIHAYTKHGLTSMLAVMAPEFLEVGETLVTDAWILSSRNFKVVAAITKPMKIAGTWYEVKATAKV